MIPLLGNKSRKEPSEELTNNTGGLMSKFNPLNLAKGVFGRKKQNSSGDMMGTDRQKLKAAVSKNKKDPEFTTIGASNTDPVRRGDSVSNVAAKLYSFMNTKYVERKKEIKQESKLAKKLSNLKEKRHQELVRALTQKPKVKEEEKKAPKKKAAKKEPPKEAAKEAPKQPKKVEEKATATPAPTASTPSAPVSAVPAAPAVSTATQVAVGAVAAIGSTAAFASGPLAENIVAHESKVSSPMSGKKTKWKNDSEYNAYNKGTIQKNGKTKTFPASFDDKGESDIDFSKMTIQEYLERGALKSGNPKKVFAVGRYQIIPETMKQIVKDLKLDPKTTYLTKETQDYLFMAGLIGTKRKKVKAYLNGDPNVSRDQAVLELAQEFASIGVPYDITVNGKIIKKGQSYYSQNTKSGLALNPPEAVGKALDAQKEKNLKAKAEQKTSPGKGAELDNKSKENKDLKKTAAAGQSTVIMNNNTTVAASGSPVNAMTTPRSDTSSFVQGAAV